MNISFLISASLALLLILVPLAVNLVYASRRAICARLSVLGFSLIACIAVFSLGFGNVFAPSFPYGLVFSSLCWLSAVCFFLFIFALTSMRRRRYFKGLYFLSLPLGFMQTWLPSVAGVPICAMLVALAFVSAAVFCMYRWLRTVTDDRARRDGEWMLLFLGGIMLALVVCQYHVHPGFIWLISIGYFILHFAVNNLKILDQLSAPENALVMDSVFDIVVILDSGGNIIRVNRRGLGISGFSPEELRGRGIERLFRHGVLDADHRMGWLESHGRREDSVGMPVGGRSPSIDAWFITTAGESIPVDLRILRLVDLAKKSTGYIVSATDMRITHQLMKEISDREYATRDLALSESKFSRMFLFNPAGIMIVDLETLRITEVNPALKDIFECDGSNLVDRTMPEIGLELTDPPYETFCGRILMEGSVPEFTAGIRLESQRILKCRLSAVTFELNRKRSMLVSIFDITTQEQMREALERKQKVETVGLLAGGIAHDFNNILAVILGHIGLAKMRIADPHARAPIEKAESACLRARELTRQLLAFSRGGKPVIGRCDTKELITESASMSVSGSSVACLFDIEKGVWPLLADKIQIGQIITNLVSNSVDVMDKGGIIEISARNRDLTTVGARKRPMGMDTNPLSAGLYVEIRVKDQGPGIPDTIREKIFDPFFTTKEKGTGLGLSIVYSIVQNHGGTISLVSHEGEGTLFSIFLPAATGMATEDGEPELLELVGKKRVLVMDDDDMVIETASGILASFGYDVVQTRDGNEAVNAYREAMESGRLFDFCILDLVVPGGLSGSACAKAILEIDRNAVLLVSSGYSNDPVLSHYADYGFKAVIPKPYTLDEFRRTLANVLVI